MPLPPPPQKPGQQLTAADIEATNQKAKAADAGSKPLAPAVEAQVQAPASRKPQTPALTRAAPVKKTVAPAVSADARPDEAPTPAAAATKKPAASAKTSGQAAESKPAAKTARSGGAAKKTSAKAAPRRSEEPARLFVLDTNVLLHDPSALFRFEEHDIFLPMVVLEELDAHKKGMTEVARNGRQTSRMLDALVGSAQGADMAQGLPLNASGYSTARGHLFFQTQPLAAPMPAALPPGKADNQILGVVAALEKQHAPRPVVLVSKDINMRVKARALGLQAEDYESDKTLGDDELLYSGVLALPPDFWQKQDARLESWQDGSHTCYRIGGPLVAQLQVNQFVYYEAPDEPALHARVLAIEGKQAVLRTLKDYSLPKNSVWGVRARNREQNFALDLLMDPDIDFVTLAGTAGTGKTLLALAAGLTQVLDQRRYTEIIMTRATVSVGEDIGFLPGTEEEKMQPWMGALDDNLEFLAQGDASGAGEWGRAATGDLMRSRVKIKSMNFMRGRTFMNRWIIVDEAQNLTPKQMKTLITRAGPGTKIICVGNLAQIDTPYLTEGSSGLTYVVDRFKGWPHGGHIQLARGERSRLADFASETL